MFNPLHYLACSSRRPMRSTRLPRSPTGRCPRRLQRCADCSKPAWAKKGKREFVQVLRLMEMFKPDDVAAGVRDAIARGAVGFDAVKHLVLCRIERRPPRLDMTIYPYLPKASRYDTRRGRTWISLAEVEA